MKSCVILIFLLILLFGYSVKGNNELIANHLYFDPLRYVSHGLLYQREGPQWKEKDYLIFSYFNGVHEARPVITDDLRLHSFYNYQGPIHCHRHNETSPWLCFGQICRFKFLSCVDLEPDFFRDISIDCPLYPTVCFIKYKGNTTSTAYQLLRQNMYGKLFPFALVECFFDFFQSFWQTIKYLLP